MEMDPYDSPSYRTWVKSGGCRSISRVKSWCQFEAGHAARLHRSSLVDRSGRDVDSIGWSDAEEWPRVDTFAAS